MSITLTFHPADPGSGQGGTIDTGTVLDGTIHELFDSGILPETIVSDYRKFFIFNSGASSATAVRIWLEQGSYNGQIEFASGTLDDEIDVAANYVYNSISYTDTEVTIEIADGLTYTTTQTPDGKWYSYTDIEVSSAVGTELPDGLYTLTFDSVIIQDGATGQYLTPEEGVSIKECRLILCGIENKLQTHFKNIILENKCCQCEELKDIWFKAWTLYRALKIASTCGIESHIPKTIKRINALCNLMSNKICNNC